MISSVSTASSSASTASTDSSNSYFQMSTDDFLTLLLTELQYQDPTDPMDTSEMISEFNSLSQVSQGEETNGYLETISQSISTMNNSQSIGFIGKTISYTGDETTGSSKTAIVTGITYKDGATYLVTDQGEISMESVTEVS